MHKSNSKSVDNIQKWKVPNNFWLLVKRNHNCLGNPKQSEQWLTGWKDSHFLTHNQINNI